MVTSTGVTSTGAEASVTTASVTTTATSENRKKRDIAYIYEDDTFKPVELSSLHTSYNGQNNKGERWKRQSSELPNLIYTYIEIQFAKKIEDSATYFSELEEIIQNITITRDGIISEGNDTTDDEFLRIEIPKEGQLTCRDCIHMEGIIFIFKF